MIAMPLPGEGLERTVRKKSTNLETKDSSLEKHVKRVTVRFRLYFKVILRFVN